MVQVYVWVLNLYFSCGPMGWGVVMEAEFWAISPSSPSHCVHIHIDVGFGCFDWAVGWQTWWLSRWPVWVSHVEDCGSLYELRMATDDSQRGNGGLALQPEVSECYQQEWAWKWSSRRASRWELGQPHFSPEPENPVTPSWIFRRTVSQDMGAVLSLSCCNLLCNAGKLKQKHTNVLIKDPLLTSASALKCSHQWCLTVSLLCLSWKELDMASREAEPPRHVSVWNVFLLKDWKNSLSSLLH